MVKPACIRNTSIDALLTENAEIAGIFASDTEPRDASCANLGCGEPTPKNSCVTLARRACNFFCVEQERESYVYERELGCQACPGLRC
jgi:hypothetical protein